MLTAREDGPWSDTFGGETPRTHGCRLSRRSAPACARRASPPLLAAPKPAKVVPFYSGANIKAHVRKDGVRIREHDRGVDTDPGDLHDLGRLMLNQGCRPDEVLSLRKEAVDLDRGYMRIVEGKSVAARRTLKLLPESRSILAARMSGDSAWIFPSPVKPGAHVTKLNGAHARVLEDTGLRFVIYDFRHTAATRWAERGMPLATLAKILGHSYLRSVMKYIHPSQDHMDEAMRRFGGGEFQTK